MLSSWKEIASYLKVDVRTAQRWDKKRPMPIHRFVTGERSHPYAYADDLDHWLAGREERQDEAADVPEPSAAPNEAPPPASNPPATAADAATGGLAGTGGPEAGESRSQRQRRPSRGLLAGISVLAVLAVSAAAFVLRLPGDPAMVRLAGARLTAADAAGRTCFAVDIPEFTDGEDTGDPPTRDEWLVADVNGDGRREVLVNVPATARGNTTGRLVAFDGRGRQLWAFAYGRSREWDGRSFSAKYRGRTMVAFQARGQRYVVGVAWHSLWFPAQVVLLDPRSGALLDEYWHPGAVYEVLPTDLDSDGEPELLLGGLSNPGLGLGHAGLAALSVPFSRTPAKAGGMAGFTGGHELAYLVFPRSDVCTAEGRYPYVTLLAADRDQHVVTRIQCGDVSFLYTLKRDLTLVDSQFSDNLLARHVQLERRGLLRHALDQEERACLQQVAHFPTAVSGNAADAFTRWSRCE